MKLHPKLLLLPLLPLLLKSGPSLHAEELTLRFSGGENRLTGNHRTVQDRLLPGIELEYGKGHFDLGFFSRFSPRISQSSRDGVPGSPLSYGSRDRHLSNFSGGLNLRFYPTKRREGLYFSGGLHYSQFEFNGAPFRSLPGARIVSHDTGRYSLYELPFGPGYSRQIGSLRIDSSIKAIYGSGITKRERTVLYSSSNGRSDGIGTSYNVNFDYKLTDSIQVGVGFYSHRFRSSRTNELQTSQDYWFYFARDIQNPAVLSALPPAPLERVRSDGVEIRASHRFEL